MSQKSSKFNTLFVWADGTWDLSALPLPDAPIYELRVPITLTEEELEELATLALKRLRVDVLQQLISQMTP
jgi:hypothetical protein